MTDYILEQGTQKVENEEFLKDPIKFTLALLKFKQNIDEIVVTSFDSDMIF